MGEGERERKSKEGREGRAKETNKKYKNYNKKKESPKKDLNPQPVAIHGLLVVTRGL